MLSHGNLVTSTLGPYATVESGERVLHVAPRLGSIGWSPWTSPTTRTGRARDVRSYSTN
jgi:hypothetical protein